MDLIHSVPSNFLAYDWELADSMNCFVMKPASLYPFDKPQTTTTNEVNGDYELCSIYWGSTIW